MPYIPEGERKELMTEPHRAAKSVGAMNYLYTVAMLKVWNANPKYQTIHKLYSAAKYINQIPEIDQITGFLGNEHKVNHNDLYVARNLAFLEFYLRVGQFYEREKRAASGDLEEYEIAVKHLNEMAQENFNKRIGFVPKEESK